ncbi:mCG145732 [Mus musculus]|nr:mCG145732 [Mus musculus]
MTRNCLQSPPPSPGAMEQMNGARKYVILSKATQTKRQVCSGAHTC